MGQTLKTFRKIHFWPHMEHTIESVLSGCLQCIQVKNYTVNVRRSQLRSATSPLDCIYVDMYDALAFPKEGHFNKFLPIVDSKTGFDVSTALSSGTWVNIRNPIFRSWILYFGVPKYLHCDQDMVRLSDCIDA